PAVGDGEQPRASPVDTGGQSLNGLALSEVGSELTDLSVDVVSGCHAGSRGRDVRPELHGDIPQSQCSGRPQLACGSTSPSLTTNSWTRYWRQSILGRQRKVAGCDHTAQSPSPFELHQRNSREQFRCRRWSWD